MTSHANKKAEERLVVHGAEHVATATDVRDLPAPTLPEIAFAGRSNVGKSSLINALVARKSLARTSGTPGCTRGLTVFRIKLSAGELELVDLPGYGYAQRSRDERRSWGPMIERFLRARTGLRAVVLLCDLRRGLLPDDVMLLEFLASVRRPVIVVATKSDKLKKSARKAALDALAAAAGTTPIAFSTIESMGRRELWQRLLAHAGLSAAETARDREEPATQWERSAGADARRGR